METAFKGVDRIVLAQFVVKRRTPTNTEMDLRVS